MNPLITIEQAAELLHLTKKTLLNYTSTKRIPYYKVSRFPMFDRDELIEWQHSFRVKTSAEIKQDAANYCLTH